MQSRFELSLGPYYFLLGMFKDYVLGTCMVLAEMDESGRRVNLKTLAQFKCQQVK